MVYVMSGNKQFHIKISWPHSQKNVSEECLFVLEYHVFMMNSRFGVFFHKKEKHAPKYVYRFI